jgi:hypothetical protein
MKILALEREIENSINYSYTFALSKKMESAPELSLVFKNKELQTKTLCYCSMQLYCGVFFYTLPVFVRTFCETALR